MWGGRESSTQTGTEPITFATNPGDLLATCFSRRSMHEWPAQASKALSLEQKQAIVDFEMALSTAQLLDNKGGLLTSAGATGGPEFLSKVTTPAFTSASTILWV
jgi:hypothetical protein